MATKPKPSKLDRRKTNKIIKKYSPLLVEILSLQDIKIQIRVEKNKQGKEVITDLGRCYSNSEYSEAVIIIYYENNKNEDDLKLTLMHEFSHVFLDSYAGYKTMVNATLDENGPLMKTLNEAYRQVDEKTVSRLSFILERMLKNA
jgi:Zn-dependent peptidase ImmA (M78 family)